MNDRIEGQGRLETIEPPEKVWQVKYRFDTTTNVVRRSGFPAVAGRSTGTIQSLDGKQIPEGEYHLHADDGEIIRVQNLGLGEWTILGRPSRR